MTTAPEVSTSRPQQALSDLDRSRPEHAPIKLATPTANIQRPGGLSHKQGLCKERKYVNILDEDPPSLSAIRSRWEAEDNRLSACHLREHDSNTNRTATLHPIQPFALRWATRSAILRTSSGNPPVVAAVIHSLLHSGTL